jgi:exonuclease VII large subunit
VKGQVDAHARHLSVRGSGLARSATRSVGVGHDRLVSRAQRLAVLPDRRLGVEELRTAQWRRLLGAYDYRRQLERGYSVTRDASGRVLRSAAELSEGSLLVTRLAEGEVVSTVTDLSGSDADAHRTRPAGKRDEGMQ